jgi:hypothetical protein
LEVAYFSAEKSLSLAAFAAPAYLKIGVFYAGLLRPYQYRISPPFGGSESPSKTGGILL